MKYLYALLLKGSFYTVALFLCCHTASAQFNLYDFKRTADIFFEKGDYYSAAQYYERFLTSKQTKTNMGSYQPYLVNITSKAGKKEVNTYESVVYRLAESYRMYFDFTNAEKWYAITTQFDSAAYPLSHYWYGVALRANTKYAAAEEQFNRFLQGRASVQDEYATSAKRELANCRFIQEQLAENRRSLLVTRLDSYINQGGATYAPVWLDAKTFVFTSSRGDSAAIVRSKGTNPYFNNVYQAALYDTGFARPVKVSVEVNKDMQQGATAFTADGRKMFLTRWVQTEGKNKGAIYVSEKSGAAWSNPVKLNINVNPEGYSTIQPFVTGDGKYLIFASDRPGGVGKYDLWYSSLDASGMPGTATNMGPGINTESDEQAPFFHSATNTLVFSSNGRVGMGGFDLYMATGNFANWGEVKNMGYPMNSTKDDMYFTSRGKKYLLTEANFSSDRSSVCCLEMFSVKKKNMFVTGKVVDCATKEPMAGASISVVDTIRNKVVYTQDIDATGTYGFETEEFQPLKLVGEKKYYLPRSLHFYKPGENGAPDTLVNPDLCMNHEDTAKPFPVGQAVVLKDIYYDFDKATLRPESYPVLDTLASVMRRFPNMLLEMSSHTDGKGTVPYNLKLSDARAKSCIDYLARTGIELSRLQSKGYGKCCPIAPNTLPNGKDNPDGRALNRRTEVKVIHY